MQQNNNKSEQPRSVRDLTDSDIEPLLRRNHKAGEPISATAVHEYICRMYPDCFDSQLRTTQRIVKEIKATIHGQQEGNQQDTVPEIFIPQAHLPGAEAQIDCTDIRKLRIKVNGVPLQGKIFTFKLCHARWIYAAVIDGERTMAVIPALQDALWKLGGVPRRLRLDNGKALFKRRGEPAQAFEDLCDHYGIQYSAINPGHPNENGSAETGNKSVKTMLRNRLMTDQDRDFDSISAVQEWVQRVVTERNALIEPDLIEERKYLAPLPSERVEACETLKRQVDKFAMVGVDRNWYSVPPEVHGKRVVIRKYSDRLIICNEDGVAVQTWPLLEGKGRYQVDYHHLMRWLQKKPGSLPECAYLDQLFPSETYRQAYEKLVYLHQGDAARIYLAILTIAATTYEMEAEVGCALKLLMEDGKHLNPTAVAELVGRDTAHDSVTAHYAMPLDL